MSKGRRIFAFATASIMALSVAAYLPVPTAKATSASCAEGVELTTGNLSRLQENGKYKLGGDATRDLYLNNGSSVELDLNGCTLSGSVTVSNGSTVTIVDSSADGTGVVTGGNGTHAAEAFASFMPMGRSGNLVINGGRFEKTVQSSGNMTVNGGVFVSGDQQYLERKIDQDVNGVFVLDDEHVVVEQKIAEDDVVFPDNVVLNETETASVKVTTSVASKTFNVAYDPVSNENFEISEDGVLTAKKASESSLKITAKQGDSKIDERTISVKINPLLKWVRIKDWNNDGYSPSAITDPTNGHCMGYRDMTAGEAFVMEIETNNDEIEPEVSIEVTNAVTYIDSELPVATISEDGKTLIAENVGYAWVEVTATYNGTTVTAHGHLYVNPTVHEVIEGDGAEYDGNNLAQEITGEMNKYRYAYFYRQEDLDAFYEKYGEDEDEWDSEAWSAYYELVHQEIDPANYQVTEGSTIITFLSSWLDTLNPGTYNVEYIFTDGYADATFVIPEPKNEVEVVTKTASVAVADTGLMTAPVNEGARSADGATIVVLASVIAMIGAVVFAKRKA